MQQRSGGAWIVGLDKCLLANFRPTLQTPGRHFQNVIRHARIGTRQLIQNVVEGDFGILATGFVAGDHTSQLSRPARNNLCRKCNRDVWRIASTNPVRTYVADGLVWNRRYLCDTNAADLGDVLVGVFAFTQTCVAATDRFYVGHNPSAFDSAK